MSSRATDLVQAHTLLQNKWRKTATIKKRAVHITKYNNKLEGTHRVRTHAVLLLILTVTYNLDLWLFSPKPYHLSRSFPLNTFGSFFSYDPDISVKNALTDPVNLTFKLYNCTTSMVSQGHSHTSLNTLLSLFLSYAADKQTNKQTDRQTERQRDRQTDSKILPTPNDIVSVGINKLL